MTDIHCQNENSFNICVKNHLHAFFVSLLVIIFIILISEMSSSKFDALVCFLITRGQSNLTKSASRGVHSPVRGHPRGLKVVPLNSWGRVSY